MKKEGMGLMVIKLKEERWPLRRTRIWLKEERGRENIIPE